MLTIESEEELLAIVDEAMMQERLGEMWYNVDVETALDRDAADDVAQELGRIRDEEREHFETFRDIASNLPGGGTPPRDDVTAEAEETLEDMEKKTNLRDALTEKRDAEDQGEKLYLEIADALKRSTLDLDTDALAETFERIAAEEADHRDTLKKLLKSIPA